MASGRILRIERLSSVDGEGLRTVVFFKGCPLKCSWCSTPESHRLTTDFGYRKDKCSECFACIESCPQGAISYNSIRCEFSTDSTACLDCRACVSACWRKARIAYGNTITVETVLDEVQRDSIFYFHSGGGVTVSGGEPLMQKDFLVALLRSCRQSGIHTAIETSGHGSWETIEEVLPHLDAIYFDLKQMNSEMHKRITGVGNELILDNLLRIDASDHALPITIRVPLIPGVNDSDENIVALGWFCKSLKNLTEVHVLPYHRLGMETYRQLSLGYDLEGLEPPADIAVEPKVAMLRRMGLKTKIGG